MAYQPPKGDSIVVVVGGTYVPPVGNALVIEFEIEAEAGGGYDINFDERLTGLDLDRVDLEFGHASGVSAEFEPVFSGGESAQATLSSDLLLGELSAHTGEYLGSQGWSWRDIRSFPEIIAAPAPVNLGLSFLRWTGAVPLGYTTTGQVFHTAGFGWGVSLTSAEPWPIITPAIVAWSDIFGTGTLYPVYERVPAVLTWQTGETVEARLAPAFNLPLPLFGGEWARVAISTLPVFPVLEWRSGESLGFDLEIESTRTNMFTGEWVAASLDTYDIVAPRFYTGETTQALLLTTARLAATAASGGVASLDLTTRPLATLAITSHHGQYARASLSSDVRLVSAAYGGAAARLDSLWLPDRPGIDVSVYRGEWASIIISTAAGLIPMLAATGEVAILDFMDEEYPYKGAGGEALSIDLATVPSFTAVAHTGESGDAHIHTRPGEELSAQAWTGDTLFSARPQVQTRAYLDVVFNTGEWMTTTWSDGTVSYDLASPPTRVETLDWFNDGDALPWDFYDDPPSWTHGTGVGVVVGAELQTRPRFALDFRAGEALTSGHGFEFQAAAAADGVGASPGSWFYTEPTTNLCTPNIFLNADHMQVELDWIELDDCYADHVYSGEQAVARLRANYTFENTGYRTGETLFIEVKPDPALRFIFWHGESVRVTLNVQSVLAPRAFQTGESVIATFEEPSALFYTGESVEASLVLYDVEFLEEGCLENEYMPTTENGDPDLDAFNPEAVEGHPFEHQIKARCF